MTDFFVTVQRGAFSVSGDVMICHTSVFFTAGSRLLITGVSTKRVTKADSFFLFSHAAIHTIWYLIKDGCRAEYRMMFRSVQHHCRTEYNVLCFLTMCIVSVLQSHRISRPDEYCQVSGSSEREPWVRGVFPAYEARARNCLRRTAINAGTNWRYCTY